MLTYTIENEIILQDSESARNKELQKAIGSLTRKQREVVYYLYYQNLSYDEIREILGVSKLKTVRNILYRSLAALRAILPKDLNSLMIF